MKTLVSNMMRKIKSLYEYDVDFDFNFSNSERNEIFEELKSRNDD